MMLQAFGSLVTGFVVGWIILSLLCSGRLPVLGSSDTAVNLTVILPAGAIGAWVGATIFCWVMGVPEAPQLEWVGGAFWAAAGSYQAMRIGN